MAQKAFYPGPIPFSLLHVDTSYKFKEMIDFRDQTANHAEAVAADLTGSVRADEVLPAKATSPS